MTNESQTPEIEQIKVDLGIRVEDNSSAFELTGQVETLKEVTYQTVIAGRGYPSKLGQLSIREQIGTALGRGEANFTFDVETEEQRRGIIRVLSDRVETTGETTVHFTKGETYIPVPDQPAWLREKIEIGLHKTWESTQSNKDQEPRK